MKDDGKGFDTSDLERLSDEKGSLGILNMRDSAKTVHGVLSISSQPGRGTEAILRLPIAPNVALDTVPCYDSAMPSSSQHRVPRRVSEDVRRVRPVLSEHSVLAEIA